MLRTVREATEHISEAFVISFLTEAVNDEADKRDT